MEHLVDFREYAILHLEDKIKYNLEEIEELLQEDCFDDFFDYAYDQIYENVELLGGMNKYLDEQMDTTDEILEKVNDHTENLTYDKLLDEYFKNYPKEYQYFIKKYHKLVDETNDLLKKRFLIKIKYDEVICWTNKYRDRKYIIFSQNQNEQFMNLLTLFRLDELFPKNNSIPVKYVFRESIYGDYETFFYNIWNLRIKNMDETSLKSVPKLSRKKQNNNFV